MSALTASIWTQNTVPGPHFCPVSCSQPCTSVTQSNLRLQPIAPKRLAPGCAYANNAIAFGASKIASEGCFFPSSPFGVRPHIQCSVVERGSESKALSLSVDGETNGVEEPEAPSGDNLADIIEWELDFCSRPILDTRGKRIWELLVCDSSMRLQHAEYFPSNRINSVTLREALEEILRRTGAPKPQKIRFFRAQLQTIITKACTELDIRPVPSQRCIALVQWLQSRYTEVYMKDPGFLTDAPPLLQLEDSTPTELPEALRGEKWAFVQLPLSGVIEEMERVNSGLAFGSGLGLEAMGLSELPLETTMIPGVAVASSRATPLAAWTSALELANLKVDPQRACLVLKTGVSDAWRYAFYRKSRQADAEASAWEQAKKDCYGLHFLAVQASLESEDCAGFWLMRDMPPLQI